MSDHVMAVMMDVQAPSAVGMPGKGFRGDGSVLRLGSRP